MRRRFGNLGKFAQRTVGTFHVLLMTRGELDPSNPAGFATWGRN